jgi:hypothetical protein
MKRKINCRKWICYQLTICIRVTKVRGAQINTLCEQEMNFESSRKPGLLYGPSYVVKSQESPVFENILCARNIKVDLGFSRMML